MSFRSILIKMSTNDIGNSATVVGALKREPNGNWRLLDANGRDFEQDFFVQFFTDPAEVLHVLDNAEEDATANNVTYNVAYIEGLVEPLLRNDANYVASITAVLL